MHSIRVEFANGDSLVTSINGTPDEIREYYYGNTFNVGLNGNDELSNVVNVVFLNEPYHMTQQRANEIYEQCRATAGCGPWSDKLRDVMTEQEQAYILQLWKTKPGYYSFAGTLLEIRNYNPAEVQ